MSECLNCNKPIIATPGKKEKRFCNSTCRSVYWKKAQDKLPGSETFVVKFDATGFTKEDMDILLIRLNGLPRHPQHGFCHFRYGIKADKAPVITVTKGNSITEEEATKEDMIKAMPLYKVDKNDRPVFTPSASVKWMPGDPKEGTGSFFLKFGALTYDDKDFKRR